MGEPGIGWRPSWGGTELVNSMQRIRFGLTGLAFVFLFVLLGTAISRSSQDSPAPVDDINVVEPAEPLAELGVAPGQTEKSNQSNQAGTKRP